VDGADIIYSGNCRLPNTARIGGSDLEGIRDGVRRANKVLRSGSRCSSPDILKVTLLASAQQRLQSDWRLG